MSAETLRWERDLHGEVLYQGEEFLGCTYDREVSYRRGREWRVLVGEDLVFLADVGATMQQPDPRIGARQALESHVMYSKGALPSAAMLLEATSGQLSG